MRSSCFILFILFSVVGCTQGILGVANPKIPPTNYSEFEAMAAKVNYRRLDKNPIITYDLTSDWKARQVHFPFVIENPNDPDSLIMFYGGGSVLIGPSYYSIGRADASKANPYTWVEYAGNPLFEPSDFSVGTIVGVDDAWWNPDENRFELACCTYAIGLGSSSLGKYYSDDGYTFTYEGTLIGPTDDETFLGNSGILRDGATWYCAYTYRTAGAVLPGVRIASSVDEGATWTKHGDFLSLGSSGAYDDKYMEGVQFLKVGSDYILNYGSAKNNGGTPNIVFSGSLAHSSTPLGTYTKSSINPFFEKSASGWDSTQVSCIVVFNVIEPWLVFYQGTASGGDYNLALWSMGMATFY